MTYSEKTVSELKKYVRIIRNIEDIQNIQQTN